MAEMWRKKVAYHEAGHAVVAHHFGDTLYEITIDTHGEMTAQGNMPDEILSEPSVMAERIMACIIEIMSVRLSGVAAEYIFRGEPKTMKHGGGADLEEVKNLFGDLSINLGMRFDVEEWMRAVFHDMVKLLKSKWTVVEALADILTQKGTITGEEAMEIIKLKGGDLFNL